MNELNVSAGGRATAARRFARRHGRLEMPSDRVAAAVCILEEAIDELRDEVGKLKAELQAAKDTIKAQESMINDLATDVASLEATKPLAHKTGTKKRK